MSDVKLSLVVTPAVILPSPQLGVFVWQYCKRMQELSEEFQCDVEGVFNGTLVSLKLGQKSIDAENLFWSRRE